MPSLGPMEMLVIFVVALLVLGPSKLPDVGRQVGRALAEFRRWSSDVQSELRDVLDVDPDYGEHVPDPTPPTLEALPEPDRDTTPHPRPPSTFPDEQSFT